MAALTPSECLEPPDGTGDLKARALWPEAFTKGGGGIATVISAVRVYVAEGIARALGVTDEAQQNEAARQWVRHRAYQQAYARMLLMPSTVGTDEGFSASTLLTQIEHVGELAADALRASNAIITAAVGVGTRPFMPLGGESGSYEIGVRY